MTQLFEQIIPRKYGDKERFTRQEAAEILGLSIRYLRELEDKGDLEPVYTGPRTAWYFRTSVVQYVKTINGTKRG